MLRPVRGPLTANAIGAVLIILGARLGLWQPLTGFGLYRSYFNPLAIILLVTGLFLLLFHMAHGEKGRAAFGGVLALVGVLGLYPYLSSTLDPQPRAVPIHDIATDTANPPVFEALDETREGARNTLDYGGPEVAQAQADAYPDIAPLQTSLPADDAFAKAVLIAEDMGWDIVATDAGGHRFEATAHAALFYFADDVVVVVTPQDNGSRLDMRSVSRVGRSDQGVNAARIRAFQAAFAG